MGATAEYKFLQQQGFGTETEETSKSHFNALLFQPIIVGSVMLLAIVTQSANLFLIFSGILWTNTIFPKANPFERLYDKTIGKSHGHGPLQPAPAPHRFMQGMAATLMLVSAITILNGHLLISYITQAFIAVAFSLLLFGKFCIGAYLYHLLTGNAQFANNTCPWSS